MNKIKCFSIAICFIVSIVMPSASCSSTTKNKEYAEEKEVEAMPDKEAKSNIKMNVKFATVEEAKRLIKEEDNYLQRLSKHDLDVRLNSSNATKQSYVDATIRDVDAWTEEEIATFEKHIIKIENRFNYLEFNINLPDTIWLVKSKMTTEFDLDSYSRGNWIALKSSFVEPDRISDFVGIGHMIHIRELLLQMYPIIVRNNPRLENKLYDMVGFKVMYEEIEIPADVKKRMILRPEVEQYNSYVTLTVDDERNEFMLFLRCSENISNTYLGGSITLMPLGANFEPITENGKTVLVSGADASDFETITGCYSDYYSSVEEMQADVFADFVEGRLDFDMRRANFIQKIFQQK